MKNKNILFLLIITMLLSVELNAAKYILVSGDINDNSSVPDDPLASFETIVPTLNDAHTYIINNLYSNNEIIESITVYIREGLYSQQKIDWIATSPNYNMTIKAYNNEKVIFDGKISDDSLKDKFFVFRGNGNRSNIVIEGLTIQNYYNGIIFGYADNGSIFPYSSHNTIKNNIFFKIGNKYSTSSHRDIKAYYGLEFQNSSYNLVESNVFHEVENDKYIEGVRTHSYPHALYIAHGSCNNSIVNNYVGLCSGDAFRVRNASNNNLFEGNYINQSGTAGFFSSWYKQITGEEPSFGTFAKDNICTFYHPTSSFTSISLFYCQIEDNIQLEDKFTDGGNNFVIGSMPTTEIVNNIVLGDISQDGIDEVIMAVNYNNFTKILRSDPLYPEFLSKVLYVSNDWHTGALEFNDFDNDGDFELITALNKIDGNETTKVIKGDGISSIDNYGLLYENLNWRISSITSGDYDGNGTTEVITAFYSPNSSNDKTQIFKGDGETSLLNLSKMYSHTWWHAEDITSGDYDGNGKDEVYVAFNAPDDSGIDNTQIYKGDGENSLLNLGKKFNSDSWNTITLTSGDFYGSGQDNIVVAFNALNESGEDNTQVFAGDGIDDIMNLGLFLSNSQHYTSDIAIGDRDGDSVEEGLMGMYMSEFICCNDLLQEETGSVIIREINCIACQECEIDLVTNTHNCSEIDEISFIQVPQNSQSILKVDLDPTISVYNSMSLEIEYGDNVSGWSLNIGDSQSNNGYGGDFGHQDNDSELQILNYQGRLYGSDFTPINETIDGNRMLYEENNMIQSNSILNIDISNNYINCENTNLVNYISPFIFTLNGQEDSGTGGVNYETYLAFNRSISSDSRIGTGIENVKLKLFNNPNSLKSGFVNDNISFLKRVDTADSLNVDILEDNNKIFFDIYPNPFLKEVTVSTIDNSLLPLNLSIINNKGIEVKKLKLVEPITTVELSHLSIGYYTLVIRKNGEVIHRSEILKK